MDYKTVIQNKNVKYVNFWPEFNPNKFLFHQFFNRIENEITVSGPFLNYSRKQRIKRLLNLERKHDFFITGENVPLKYGNARKYIGFWRSYNDRNDVLRFPYWMWYLDYTELKQQPSYERYGMRLSIPRLLKPISESYSEQELRLRLNKAILFSGHMREPRRTLYEVVDHVLGCDIRGAASGIIQESNKPKMATTLKYRFALCPENSLGDGYVTEKIPEAFHSGCIPITYIRQEDLATDFNPEAVINLHGMDEKQRIAVLKEVQGGGEFYRSLISVPLLKDIPKIDRLINFIISN